MKYLIMKTIILIHDTQLAAEWLHQMLHNSITKLTTTKMDTNTHPLDSELRHLSICVVKVTLIVNGVSGTEMFHLPASSLYEG